jgi:hypothetical protein
VGFHNAEAGTGETSMVRGLVTMHVNSEGVTVQKNTARSCLREYEIRKRCMIPKHSIVLYIENCTELINNQVHQFCVPITGMEFPSNGRGYTFLRAEECMKNA